MWHNFLKRIYDRARKRKYNKRKRGSSFITVLPIKVWELPRKSNIIDFFQNNFSERIYVNNWKEDIGTFDLQKYQVIITLMPNQINWIDFDNDNKINDNEKKSIDGHKAYLIISINGGYESEEINKSVLLSRVAAAIIDQGNVLGVYWDNSLKIRNEKEFYFKAMKTKYDEERKPYELWVDIKIKLNSNFTQNIYTVGMESLGHYDIEINNTRIDSYILYVLLYELSCNMLKEGLRIEEDELLLINNIKLKARYLLNESIGRTVLRLEEA